MITRLAETYRNVGKILEPDSSRMGTLNAIAPAKKESRGGAGEILPGQGLAPSDDE